MIIKDNVKMNKIKEPNFDNIHGHVTIDLHNHNSGFTERIETDNLVTDAIKHLYCALMRDVSDKRNLMFPIATRALGGIMLFNGSLTESMSNTGFPSDAKLVGYAGQTQVTADTMMGSYNIAESGPISTGHKAVWDFSTSQANGTISSLARCHSEIGSIGSSDISNGLDRTLVCGPEYTNGKSTKYYIPSKYSSNGSCEFLWFGSGAPAKGAYKIDLPLTDVGVSTPPILLRPESDSSCELIDTIDYDIDSSYSVPLGTQASNGLVSIVRASSNSLYYDRISTIDYSKLERITFTVEGADFVSNVQPLAYGNYAYIPKSNGLSIYKINMQNQVIESEIQMPSGYTVPNQIFGRFMKNGVLSIYARKTSDNTIRILLLYPDGTFLITSAGKSGTDGYGYSNFIYPNNTLFVSGSPNTYSNNAISFNVPVNYLGTIANISSVTKTASQSMKITYTLTNS